MRGHLRALNTIIPLSTLNPSVGSPSIFHCRTTTGSPSVPCQAGWGLGYGEAAILIPAEDDHMIHRGDTALRFSGRPGRVRMLSSWCYTTAYTSRDEGIS